MKPIAPHPFASCDTPRPADPYSPRSCDRCGLPETRADVHAMPPVDADVAQVEARKLGESEER